MAVSVQFKMGRSLFIASAGGKKGVRIGEV
jgi:hypothetical protein